MEAPSREDRAGRRRGGESTRTDEDGRDEDGAARSKAFDGGADRPEVNLGADDDRPEAVDEREEDKLEEAVDVREGEDGEHAAAAVAALSSHVIVIGGAGPARTLGPSARR